MSGGSSLTIRGGDITINGPQYNSSSNLVSAIDIRDSQVNFESGNITINGRYIGLSVARSTVNISGGNITINGERSIDADYSTINISGGAVNLGTCAQYDTTFNHTGGVVYDQTTNTITAKSINGDYTIPANMTVTVAEGETLKITDGAVLTVAEGGTLVNNGTLDFCDGAKLVNNGTFTHNGMLYMDGELHVHELGLKYENLGDGTHRIIATCPDCPIGYMETSVEEHIYQYSGSDVRITESCHGCDLTNEMYVSGAQTIIYYGGGYIATIRGTPVNPKVSMALDYENNMHESLGQAPADAGEYFIYLVVMENGAPKFKSPGASFTIEPTYLDVVGVEVKYKDYDGTPYVEVDPYYGYGGFKVDGVVNYDNIEILCTSAELESANAGTYDKVTVKGLTVTGEDAHNYMVDSEATVPVYDLWSNRESSVTVYERSVLIKPFDQEAGALDAIDQSKWEVDEYYGLLEGHRIDSVKLVAEMNEGSTKYGSICVEEGSVKIVDAEGNDVTENYGVSTYSATLTFTCPDHDEFEEGFCKNCGGYEKAVYNENEGYYEIGNAGQLFWFAEYVANVTNEANAKLIDNITIPEGKEWTPIYNLYGTFDGNFKTISGLRVNETDSDYVGFLGYIGYYANVYNLHITNSSFVDTDATYAGAIVGYHGGGEITNCYTDESVKIETNGVCGALAGYTAYATMKNCYAHGALVGNGYYGTFENCYYLGEDDEIDGTTAVTAQQLASGEVAYLLQAGVQGEDIYDEDWNYIETIIPEIWGQSIGKDAYPVFGGMKVYQAEDGTYNNGEIEKFDIDVARMILGNALEFQFGVAMTKIPDTTGYYAVIEKTWADGTTTTKTIPATQWGTAGQYWAIVYDGLAAKEMSDVFYVTIYNADGVAVSNAREDSVRAYVERAYASQSSTGKTMMVDMLNYGAAVQVHFSYGTEDLCNNKLTDEQKAVGTAEVATLNNNQVKGANYLGTRFILENRIQVQVAFEGLTSDMYAIYSYTDNNGKLQEVRVEGTDFITAGNMKGVELSALVYADARTLVKVLVYTADGTLYAGAKDSIESCSYRSGGDVFTELMKFADSAKAHLYG